MPKSAESSAKLTRKRAGVRRGDGFRFGRQLRSKGLVPVFSPVCCTKCARLLPQHLQRQSDGGNHVIPPPCAWLCFPPKARPRSNGQQYGGQGARCKRRPRAALRQRTGGQGRAREQPWHAAVTVFDKGLGNFPSASACPLAALQRSSRLYCPQTSPSPSSAACSSQMKA